MPRVLRSLGLVVGLLLAGASLVQAAEELKAAAPAMDPAKQAAMEAMQQLGSPSEGHKALEPFVGSWTYTLEWRMAPDAPPETMTGTAANSLILGGRFLKQAIAGTTEGHPPFEGIGFTGYDNIRKEYTSVWIDNMGTGMMVGTGQFDVATKTLTEQSDFSCPMTGEAHRKSRAVWKVVDADHHVYESHMQTPEGQEFKAMEIRYTRAQ